MTPTTTGGTDADGLLAPLAAGPQAEHLQATWGRRKSVSAGPGGHTTRGEGPPEAPELWLWARTFSARGSRYPTRKLVALPLGTRLGVQIHTNSDSGTRQQESLLRWLSIYESLRGTENAQTFCFR